jgi:hypothetical protein
LPKNGPYVTRLSCIYASVYQVVSSLLIFLKNKRNGQKDRNIEERETRGTDKGSLYEKDIWR